MTFYQKPSPSAAKGSTFSSPPMAGFQASSFSTQPQPTSRSGMKITDPPISGFGFKPYNATNDSNNFHQPSTSQQYIVMDNQSPMPSQSIEDNTGPYMVITDPSDTSKTGNYMLVDENVYVTTRSGSNANMDSTGNDQSTPTSEELFDGALEDLKLDSSRLKIHSNLGHGFFADTYQATYTFDDGTSGEVAVKRIVLSSFRQQSDVALFAKEVSIWSKLQHPNLVHLIGYVVDNHQRYSVMELLGPTLNDVLKAEREEGRTIPPGTKLTFCIEIAQALAYMHRWTPPVLHRDLTPSNVLLTQDLTSVKVGDFGLAREALSEGMTMTSAVGNCTCMAPEVFKGGKYHTSADVYSYGMLLYQIWANPDDLCEGLSPQVWASLASSERKRPPLDVLKSKIPDSLIELISSCWAHEPRVRPNFMQIVDYLPTLFDS